MEGLRKPFAGATLVGAVQFACSPPSTSVSFDSTWGLVEFLSEKYCGGDDTVKWEEVERECAKR